MELPSLNLIIPDSAIGPKLQAAVNQAKGTSPQTVKSAVWIPATYSGTDTYTNPSNIPVFDMRGSGSISFGGGGGTPSTPLHSLQFNNATAFGGATGFNYFSVAEVGVASLTNFTDATESVSTPCQLLFESPDGNNICNLVVGSTSISFTIEGPAATLIAGNGSIVDFTNSGGAAVILLGSASTTLGFFGSGGTTQPTVTGSRGANAALASLLSALANLGLIVDSTS